MIQLIGILIVIVGFVLKLDTIAVVIGAGIVTGLVSGLGITELLTVLGESFVNTRYMSIFLISLPVIGMLEKNGLKNTAKRLILKIKKATVGHILDIYLFARITLSIFGIRLGGHVQFIRPIVYPMLEGVANLKGKIDNNKADTLKATACAVENYGNFYGQNVFIANSGVLLIVATLQDSGVGVTNVDVALYSLIIALTVVCLAPIQIFLISKHIKGVK